MVIIILIPYLIEKNLLGKETPLASSLHIKVKDPKKFVTPSPGAYNPQNANKVSF